MEVILNYLLIIKIIIFNFRPVPGAAVKNADNLGLPAGIEIWPLLRPCTRFWCSVQRVQLGPIMIIMDDLR
jgi:hypothetical protein